MSTVVTPEAFNAMFGFNNWSGNVTWSGGSFDTDYPVANLALLPLSQVAETTDLLTASCQAIGTLDRPRGVGLVTVHGDNLSLKAQIKLSLYRSSSLLYTTGFVDRWSRVYAWAGRVGAPNWYSRNWWNSKYSVDQLADIIGMKRFALPKQYYADELVLEWSDPTNADGVTRIGYVDVSEGTQLSVNYLPGAATRHRFRTIAQEGQGGVKGFDRRNKPRTFNGECNLPRNEAFDLFYELRRQMDADVAFAWCPWPNSERRVLQENYLARISAEGGGIDIAELVAGEANDDDESLNLARARVTFALEEVL